MQLTTTMLLAMSEGNPDVLGPVLTGSDLTALV